MNRLDELLKALEIARKMSYIPVSMREDVLNLERELLDLEEKSNV